MVEIIKNILSKNADLISKVNRSIVFENDIEGKRLLNKEIFSLYNKNTAVSEKELVNVVINGYVIIEKMSKLKNCGWDIPELKTKLADAVANYQRQKDNESAVPKSGLLNATAIGKHFDISSQRLNLILAELGWIEKDISGWSATKLGKALGGKEYEHEVSGGTYVLWPHNILENRNLTKSFKEIPSSTEEQKTPQAEKQSTVARSAPDGFREKFPATLRTKDGHLVRSRAEVIIDNALYDYRLAHAYERKLPIDEDVYSDFFIPTENVYIEFWGMEEDPKYAERKKAKVAIYEKYDFKLIQLTDQDISNLDDHLPKKLLKFGIKVY